MKVLTLLKAVGMVFVIGVVMSIQTNSTNPDGRLIEKTAKSTTRFTLGGRGIASGSFVRTPKGKVVVLTNHHVCAVYSSQPPTMEIYNGPTIVAPIIATDRTIDLCALEIPARGLEAPAINLGSENTHFSRILIMGHPLGGSLTPFFGYVLSRGILPIVLGMAPDNSGCPEGTHSEVELFINYCVIDMDLIMTNATTFPGNSGSPAVDLNGNLIGVLNSGDNRSNYGNIIPLDIVKKFLGGL
jgi:S1-C subfamily serine protease